MAKINKTYFKKHYPKRTKDSYKNLNGKVFIIAGSKNMSGAAVLSARAAYRAGAGFITVATVKQNRSALIKAVPEALILDIKSSNGCLNGESLKQIKTYLKQNPQDVILAGCGLGKGAQIILNLLKAVNLPAVIDADGLNYIAKAGVENLKGLSCILTPHEGEIKRLLGKIPFDKNTAAKNISALSGAVCLLKGPNTQVCLGSLKNINTSGNEGLAKAGSGDVLSGVIAALWAKLIKSGLTAQSSMFAAACLGVFLHGAAADYCVEKISKESLMASDVISALPFALKKLLD